MYVNHQHFWWTMEAAFRFLCYIGASFFVLWLIGVCVSSCAQGQQSRAKRRRLRSNHQVGGVIRP